MSTPDNAVTSGLDRVTRNAAATRDEMQHREDTVILDETEPGAHSTEMSAATSQPSRRVAAPPRRQRLVEESTPPADTRAPREPIRWSRLAMVSLVTVLVLGPLVLLTMRAATTDWIPGGDRAVIEMHVRDVGTHTPLIGPYSRYGWSHPGPLLYWVLAIPYRIMGSTSSALLAGTALMNSAAIAGTLAIAWRRGRLPLLTMTGVAIMVLCHALGSKTLADPWNPYVTALPLLVFVALGWTLREGDGWAAPLLVVVGSFLVQSHVGYLGIVLAVGAWAAFGWSRERWIAGATDMSRWRRLGRALRPGPAIAISALVAGSLWAPVAVDQVRGSHNLTRVTDYFASSSEPAVGPVFAVGVVTRHLIGLPLGEGKTRPPWLGGDEPVNPIGGGEVPVNPIWLVLATTGFVVLAAAVRRRCRYETDPAILLRDSGALRLQMLVGLCITMAVVSIARVTGVVYDYLILWLPILAMLAWLSAAWSLWCVGSHHLRGLPALWRSRRILGTTVGILVLLWSSVVLFGEVGRFETPEGYNRDPVSALAPAAIAATPRGGPVLIESAGGGPTNMTDGIRLQLERADRPTVSRHEDAFKFGAHRDASSTRPVTEVWVVSGDAIVDWSKRGEHRQVAIWDPLPAAQRARYFEDVEVLRNQILAAHRMDLFDALYGGDSLYLAHGLKGIDQDLLKRIEDQRSKGRPVAVFVGSAPAF